MFSSRMVNNAIGKGSFMVWHAHIIHTLPYIDMWTCSYIYSYAYTCAHGIANAMRLHVFDYHICMLNRSTLLDNMKRQLNVFVGSMHKLLYISSDFHGPRMLQRGPEFSPNYIINYLIIT